jgi:hypothetical protein
MPATTETTPTPVRRTAAPSPVERPSLVRQRILGNLPAHLFRTQTCDHAGR